MVPMRILKRYADWCRKRASTAQCSPVLGVLGVLAVMAGVIYVYRQVILDTLLTALFAVLLLAATVAVGALTITTVKWYRRRAAALAAAIPAPATAEPQDTPNWPGQSTDADEAAISEEADWLASGVELAFGPDGSLKAKGGS